MQQLILWSADSLSLSLSLSSMQQLILWSADSLSLASMQQLIHSLEKIS
jgi:hypothetical protein